MCGDRKHKTRRSRHHATFLDDTRPRRGTRLKTESRRDKLDGRDIARSRCTLSCTLLSRLPHGELALLRNQDSEWVVGVSGGTSKCAAV